MKIGILGMGGVGGYFGGRLAAYYANDKDIQIIFFSTPATIDVIKEQGLKLITPEGEQTVYPHLATTDANEAGVLDVLICCTKSYDLAAAIAPLAACIGPDTLILPLLNGVDASEIIRSVYPEANVLEGCVYVNAQKTGPGVIKKTAAIEQLYFGSTSIPVAKLAPLQDIFKKANLDSYLSENIATDTWTKYVFTAGMATSTSYFDETLGKVMETPAHRQTLEALVSEAYQVSQAAGITLPAGMVALTIKKLEVIPYEGTSSMHRDYMKGGKTEYRSLTKYIADMGDTHGIDTPTFDRVLPELTRRAGS